MQAQLSEALAKISSKLNSCSIWVPQKHIISIITAIIHHTTHDYNLNIIVVAAIELAFQGLSMS